jgi:OFA family oxalate/formate antiporter-like MFS transporter
MNYLNRWVYAVIGIVILLFAGLIYAWTVLQAPIALMFPDWTKGQISLTFTITMFCFCIGGLVGGMMQKRLKPQILVWISAVLFPAGFTIAAAANSPIMLYLGFGVLAGLASGLAYNAVMGSVSRWFPDKQGFISGILLMGFGLSSFIIGKVYTAVTPADGSDAWRTTFKLFGIVLFAAMALGGFFVVKPDNKWKGPNLLNTKKIKNTYEEINAGEMLKRPSFWLYFVWATFLSASGLAIISQGTPMAMQACPGITMGTVATTVGFISVFNGAGRIIFGALFDKIGRFWTMLIGGIVFIISMILLLAALSNHSMVILASSYIVTGLAYGCVTPANSAFTNLFYGQKNYPANLSIVNMCLLIASFGSTIAGIVFDITKSYTAIIVIAIVFIVLGTIISCFIRKPKTSV